MVWQIIIDFPSYEVSSTGLIRRIGKKSNLAFSKSVRNFTTYNRVTLFLEGKRCYRQVHRLVAEAFIPNPMKLSQVDHLDNNGENNLKENLEWVTASQNIQRSFERNPKKVEICSKGGKASGAIARLKAEARYKNMLGTRFIKFYPCGELAIDAAVTYLCECGVQRTSSIMWKDLRSHQGKCPVCTNTINRSACSLI